MAEALALVRRELGADAVILHTRTYKRGGFLGLGGHTMVEITATDESQARPRVRRKPAKRPEPKPHETVPQSPQQPSEPQVDMMDHNAGDLIRRTYQLAREEAIKQRRTDTAVAQAASSAPAATTVTAATPLADEMRAVRCMVEKMMTQQKSVSFKENLPKSLFDQYLALIEQEVTEELAQKVISEVSEKLDAKQCSNKRLVKQAVAKSISQYIPVSSAKQDIELTPTGDDRPRTIALIGPTGVGKTTTVAKLAATFKLKQGKNVGLITLDTYRIAAVEQLRTYADIIGLPLHVVNTPEELRRAVHKCRGCDVVLIDTAGRSQRDDPRLQQLGQFVDAANPHEVHLVLSSTSTQKVMMQAVERFSAIRADRIIFTKLDEAVTFGVLVNVIRAVGKELSYVTTGQEVPHQIECGQAAKLAEMVLEGECI